MAELAADYLPILIFLGLAIGLGLVLMLAAVVVAVRNPDPEKVSAYECGFNAFDDARMKFDVRFYLVSIPIYHIRPRSGLSFPLGRGLPWDDRCGILVDDGVSGGADRRVRL